MAVCESLQRWDSFWGRGFAEDDVIDSDPDSLGDCDGASGLGSLVVPNNWAAAA